MNWNKYPFIRMVSALALGILICDKTGWCGFGKLSLMGLLVLLLTVDVVLHRTLKSYRYRWVFGVTVVITIVWLGYVRAVVSRQDRAQQGWCANAENWRLAHVLEPPEEREKTVKVQLALECMKTDTGIVKTPGRVMAYFQKDEWALNLCYGDLVAFSTPLEEVSPPKNPMEFDYKKYLERRGVTWSVYLQSGKWLPTGIRKANPVFSFAYRFRQRMLVTLQRCGINENEFGVGAAILLGYDECLPAQVRNNYVAAGSMHILCVSGMHVGIIYLLASFMLGFLGKSKRMAFIRKIILLFLIWFYALITGLSPSILRASLMISFVVFGELIHRKGFALNSIAASAFVILLVDPNNLFAIGFQLSYVAVIGIVLLQKPIYNLVYVKNKWLDKAWEITAVSIAAQLATMPFTVYYFNQFTPYFWLSNLLMTPLSFLVILAGMLLLLLSWLPWVNMALGKLLWMGLHAMNGLVAGIERLPLSLVKGLYVSDFQFALSLLLLLLFWLLVNLRRKRMVMEMLTVFVVFAFSLAFRNQQLAHQSRMVIYSLRNHTAISVVDGFDQMLLCDEALLQEPSAIDYSLKGHWAEEQLTMNPRCHTLTEDFDDGLMLKRKHLISARGVLLAIWDPFVTSLECDHQMAVDYLMVREKQKPDLSSVIKAYRVGMLLIDGSVPDYLAKEWIRQAEALEVPYRNVRDCAVVI